MNEHIEAVGKRRDGISLEITKARAKVELIGDKIEKRKEKHRQDVLDLKQEQNVEMKRLEQEYEKAKESLPTSIQTLRWKDDLLKSRLQVEFEQARQEMQCIVTPPRETDEPHAYPPAETEAPCSPTPLVENAVVIATPSPSPHVGVNGNEEDEDDGFLHRLREYRGSQSSPPPSKRACSRASGQSSKQTKKREECKVLDSVAKGVTINCLEVMYAEMTEDIIEQLKKNPEFVPDEHMKRLRIDPLLWREVLEADDEALEDLKKIGHKDLSYKYFGNRPISGQTRKSKHEEMRRRWVKDREKMLKEATE